MLYVLRGIFSNYYINVAICAWFCAQVCKVLIAFMFRGKIVWERFIGAGGMPSSHTALVCALALSMARSVGVSSPEFALSVVFACIVMYDAMGVRRAAGEHAKVLNKLVFGFQIQAEESENTQDDQISEDLGEKALKEYLGHTPLEVLGGMLLGILVAMIFPR